MYKEKSTLFLLCETALHAGSGDDVGIVDLPIQREKHTQFPKIESSSLKGALREAFEQNANSKAQKFNDWKDDDVIVHRLFGFDEGSIDNEMKDKNKETAKQRLINCFKYTPNGKNEKKEGHDRSGCIAFTDARLLLFPVKSMKGVFVWVTCPQVLNKFAADLAINGVTLETLNSIKSLDISEGKARVASSAPLVTDVVILEEYAYDAIESSDVQKFAEELSEIIFSSSELEYWKGLLQKNLVILSDTDFRDFTQMSTDVITRTKIDNETGTVQDGALFTEEYLPNDSVMYTSIFASDEYGHQSNRKNAKEVMDHVVKKIEKDIKYFQLGGNATLGKGILKTAVKRASNG
jgi:CRISPR-associated protein Cmr4